MTPLDLLPKRLGQVLPYEHVHPKREITFLERFPQVRDLASLTRIRKRHQVKIG